VHGVGERAADANADRVALVRRSRVGDSDVDDAERETGGSTERKAKAGRAEEVYQISVPSSVS